MPRVRLLHPVAVYLRKSDKEQTAVMDDRLHEPVGQVRRDRKPIKLVAQINDGRTKDPAASSGGVVESSDGYLLFRTKDLRAARVEVERGDRIVQIGDPPNDHEVDYYITKLKYMGHYPDKSGASLVRAYYEDREPSRHRN
jgi:hypothetical protein